MRGGGGVLLTVVDENPSWRQCCGSGMFIPDPDFYRSRIPDPGSRIPNPGSKNSNERQGWKKDFCHTFFWSHKFTKLNYFIFEMLKKKIWANFQRITELFTQQIVTKLLNIWVCGPGSEIRDPEKTYSGSGIPDPGSRGPKGTDPESGSATLHGGKKIKAYCVVTLFSAEIRNHLWS
jgi:hypothetical protein